LELGSQIGTFEQQSTHVGDIEHPCLLAYRSVFLGDALKLDGHFPTRKSRHPGLARNC